MATCTDGFGLPCASPAWGGPSCQTPLNQTPACSPGRTMYHKDVSVLHRGICAAQAAQRQDLCVEQGAIEIVRQACAQGAQAAPQPHFCWGLAHLSGLIPARRGRAELCHLPALHWPEKEAYGQGALEEERRSTGTSPQRHQFLEECETCPHRWALTLPPLPRGESKTSWSPQPEPTRCCRNFMSVYTWPHIKGVRPPSWFGGFRGFLGLIEGCQDSPDHLCAPGFGSFHLRVHIEEVLGPVHCHIVLVICQAGENVLQYI